MGKTSFETTKKWREELKKNEEKIKKYRKKEAERQRVYRRKMADAAKKDEKLLQEKRTKDRIRQQRRRGEINKSVRNFIPESSYKCKQTLGKAIGKVEKALPIDLSKKVELIEKLYKKYVEPLKREQEKHLGPVESINIIKEFFMRDGISVQAPGRKDTVIYDGKIVPKRFMLLTVGEAYQLYKNEFTIESVGKSFFYQHRPSYIQLIDKMPHNMCVCKYHANFAFLLESCAKVIPTFPNTFERFLQLVCCNVLDENCMAENCQNCVRDIEHDLIPLRFHKEMEKNLKWKYWRKMDNRLTLSYTIGTLSELIREIEAQLPIFKLHSFVKQCQQRYFNDKKINVTPDEVVFQIDFAENYRLVNQNEIQDAHFSYQQVTIFTCVAWLFGKSKSFAIISDKLTHNKFDVYCFITKIMLQIREQYKDISSIYIFSDGSSAQFKNKFILKSIPSFVNEFSCKYLEWNFFATSHGKGAVDGIGAIVKRKVWQVVKANELILPDAFSFYECAHKYVEGVNLLYVAAEEIETLSSILNEKWQNVQPIPKIKKLHTFAYHDSQYINISRTAYSLRDKIKI